MFLARFFFFSDKKGTLRPFFVFSTTFFLVLLLALSILEISILILGALGIAPPVHAIDFAVKLKTLILSPFHNAK
jgi:hypothetical protein